MIRISRSQLARFGSARHFANGGSRLASIAFFVGAASTVIALLAIRHRFFHWGGGLSIDETIAIYIAKAPTITELLKRQSLADYSPPLFNLVLSAWGHLFGFGETSVVALAATFAYLTVAAVAWASWEAFGPLAGLLGGILASSHSLLIEIGNDVRPYGLLSMLSAVSMALLLRLECTASDPSKPRWALKLSMGAALCLTALSHYSGTLFVAALGILALIATVGEVMPRQFYRSMLLSTVSAGVLFLPWVPIVLRQLKVGIPWYPHLNSQQNAELVAHNAFRAFPVLDPNSGLLMSLGLAIVAGLAIASIHALLDEMRARRSTYVLLVFPMIVGFGVMASQGPDRYLIVAGVLGDIFVAGLCAVVVLTASRSDRPTSFISIAGIVILAVAVSAQAYSEERLAFEARKKEIPHSAVRSAFFSGHLRADDEYVVVPDYMAAAVIYYGRVRTLHGFPKFDPLPISFEDYTQDWEDGHRVAQVVEFLASERTGSRRIVVIVRQGLRNVPVPHANRIREFLAEMHRRFSYVMSERYFGTQDNVDVVIFDRRSS